MHYFKMHSSKVHYSRVHDSRVHSFKVHKSRVHHPKVHHPKVHCKGAVSSQIIVVLASAFASRPLVGFPPQFSMGALSKARVVDIAFQGEMPV